MPVLPVRVALGANATVSALAGSAFEFLPNDSLVEFGILADAVGVLATVQSGSDVLMEEGPVGIGTINQMPKYPDDFYLQDVAARGEKLKIQLRDTSGVARVVMVMLRITPVG